jgi:hypothetical protein
LSSAQYHTDKLNNSKSFAVFLGNIFLFIFLHL